MKETIRFTLNGKPIELDVDGGEMFFFMMHITSRGRAIRYDPNAFRVQVYLNQ